MIDLHYAVIDMTMTSEQNTRYQLRQRLKQRHRHKLDGLTGSALKQELDKLEAEYHAPKKWAVSFGSNRQRRRAYQLYQACLKVHVARLRARGDVVSAGKLEAYLNSLVDVSPRYTEFYDAEWKLISEALRPQGSSPTSPRARQAYSIYQWLTRSRKLIEGTPV